MHGLGVASLQKPSAWAWRHQPPSLRGSFPTGFMSNCSPPAAAMAPWFARPRTSRWYSSLRVKAIPRGVCQKKKDNTPAEAPPGPRGGRCFLLLFHRRTHWRRLASVALARSIACLSFGRLRTLAASRIPLVRLTDRASMHTLSASRVNPGRAGVDPLPATVPGLQGSAARSGQAGGSPMLCASSKTTMHSRSSSRDTIWDTCRNRAAETVIRTLGAALGPDRTKGPAMQRRSNKAGKPPARREPPRLAALPQHVCGRLRAAHVPGGSGLTFGSIMY